MSKLENNDGVLAGIKVIASALAWFQPTLKGWHKQAGSKPTDAMLMVPVLMGKRPGVEALHVAMCLRPEGCTVAQFCLAGSCGPANNYRRQLVKAGWFSTTVEGKPYAFKLTLTAKGAAKLEKAAATFEAEASVAKADKPAKPAKKAKGKRKGATVIDSPAPVTPTSEAPTADTGVTETVVGPHSDVATHTEIQPAA
jgi:hypothetical protein